VTRNLAQRYAAWIDSRRAGILVLSVLIALLGGYLAWQLPLRTDLSSLLPSSRQSVRDLTALEQRARAFGQAIVVIESDDIALRERAGELIRQGLERIDKRLVSNISADDGPLHRYVWRHKFLFAETPDLIAARDAIRDRIERGKLAENPLYIDLGEPGDRDRLAELRQELADLEAKATRPPARVSADGRIQLIIVHATFQSSDQALGAPLVSAIRRVLADAQRQLGPGVTFAITGTVPWSLIEHESVLEDMWLAAIITLVLCALGLLRSGISVFAVLWALGVGVIATLAIAWAAIGHLNTMSAFLTAIVIGNGMNAGMIVTSRYLEEVREGRSPDDALAPALRGALHGTFTAMLTAVAAYAALMVTDFRGFRHFGAIGVIGMALTWLAAFTILPAALCVLARRGRIRPPRTAIVGRILARMLPRRLGLVVGVAAIVVAVSAAIAVDYIASDPFTRDWRDLQSENRALRRLHAVDQKLRINFDSGALFGGISYQLVMAVDHRDQVAPLIAKLKADDAARGEGRELFYELRSIDDMLPPEQDTKIELLGEIRRLLDDPALVASLDDPEDRRTLAAVRPPDDLRPVVDTDIPAELAWPFIEKDGAIGRLIVVRGARRFRTWDVGDRQYFAGEIRALQLPPGTIVGGEPLVIADIVASMTHDAPIMIGVALAGSVLAVWLVLGLRRHGMVTVICGLAGVTVMIAACALVGLRVHFLDLIALPITIGIGIEYAVNLCARDRDDGERGPRHLLATTGGAVLLCSYTTIVAYGSVLLSSNGGIRAFGLAAILGEIACIVMALLVAPALLTLLRKKAAA
jgi:predicted RND superfamily exporter protein